MKKIAALHAFLLSLDLVAAENIESFVDEPNIQPSGNFSDNGFNTGVCFYEQTYTAAFYIERYPFKHHAPEVLFANISVWIMNNDPLRDGVADLQTDVAVNDDETADIEILIPFREPVFGIEDAAGSIDFKGLKYRLADPGIEAENFESGYILNRS